MDDSGPAPASPRARGHRRCTADYRWTQPKVIAFLEALAHCGKVAEAARAVGMSATSAYRLRARLASARFDAAFEGARKSGTRARAAASKARMTAARSVWEGPGIAELIAREGGANLSAQGGGSGVQGVTSTAQGDGPPARGDAFRRKVPV